MNDHNIRVRETTIAFMDYRYRTPIKFGGVVLDRVTILDVTMTVETIDGKVATGVGSMPLGNVWAWPTRALEYATTLDAMKALAKRIPAIYRDTIGHPIEITHAVESQFFTAAEEIVRVGAIAEPFPKLAALVVASAFDAALHDAYGKVHGLNCYHTYGRSFLPHTLDRYLGKDFASETLDRYLLPEPTATLPLYHLVGALDPLTSSDVSTLIGDCLPESLEDWIRKDGLTHLKIKLNGDNLDWDVQRVMAVDRVADLCKAIPGTPRFEVEGGFFYSLDFNERCQSVDYLLTFLEHLKAEATTAFARIQYIEQPTARDLKANPANRMHAAAKLRPVVIDESLLDLETLHLAQEMGYTGVALKACKGQTQSLLLAAAAQKLGLFRCVQDLTCPGASLIQSAGLAAHIPGVVAIEANSRQYCPSANAAWEPRFPGLFTIRGGQMPTGQLTGLGLGAV